MVLGSVEDLVEALEICVAIHNVDTLPVERPISLMLR